MINREQKIEAIKAILSGVPPKKVLPIQEVLIVEDETNTSVILMGGGELVLKNDKVKPFLEVLKKRMPHKFIEVTRISKALFDKYNLELEAEY